MLHLKDLPETATAQEVHQLETVGAHLPTDPTKIAKTQRKRNKKHISSPKSPIYPIYPISWFQWPVLVSFKAPLFGRRGRRLAFSTRELPRRILAKGAVRREVTEEQLEVGDRDGESLGDEA